MELPRMTPLQALVVQILFAGEQPSRAIGEELAAHGVKMRMNSVYRLLGRMELAQHLCGRYRQYQTVDGRTIRERHYRVSEIGFAEWQKTIAFYTALEPPDDTFRPLPMTECYQHE